MKKRNNVTDNQNQTGVRTKKKRSFVDWLLLIAAVLLLLGAGVLFSLNSIKNKQREEKTNDILANIEQGQATIIVNADALPVEGEEIETFNIKPSGADGTDTSSGSSAAPSETTIPYEAENVVLTAVGTLKIDAIDLEQPLLDDAGIIPLRYAPGIQEGTAMPGQEGNCVILGHRMKAKGAIFNRLEEVRVGDTAVITLLDGTVCTYTIDTVIPKLDPAQLPDYISIDSGSGKQITLITCSSTGGTTRYLAIGHMA